MTTNTISGCNLKKNAIKRLLIEADVCNFAAKVAEPVSSATETGDRTQVANYVATMSADLAAMARRHGLDTLGYLLEMARLEAENEARHTRRNGAARLRT